MVGAAEAREAEARAAHVAACRAMCDLGLSRVRRGVELTEAVAWLRSSVEASNVADGVENATVGQACYALAFCHDNGRGVPRSGRESDKWMARARGHRNKQAKEHFDGKRATSNAAHRLIDLLLVCFFVFLVCAIFSLLRMLGALAELDAEKAEMSGSDPRTVRAVRWHDARIEDRETLLKEAYVLLGAKQPLSDSFEGTRGVVIHFKRAALEDAHAFRGPLRWLRDGFLRDLVDDRCNAFVFNVLVIPAGRGGNGTFGVGAHVDQTLMQPATHFGQTAFHVTVGYVRVPPQIDGGDLVVEGQKYAPRQGSILRFRGDLSHKVASFCVGADGSPAPSACPRDSADESARVSFVFEQYRLTPEKLRLTPSFLFSPSSVEQQLLPTLFAFPGGRNAAEAYLKMRKRIWPIYS